MPEMFKRAKRDLSADWTRSRGLALAAYGLSPGPLRTAGPAKQTALSACSTRQLARLEHLGKEMLVRDD